MKKKYLLFLFVCCISLPLYAQGPSQQYLEMIDYEELLALYNDFESDSTTQKRIILTYRDRALKEGDSLNVARSYDRLARIFHPQKNIQYADSLIALTKNWDNVSYPVDGYLLKAYEFSKMGLVDEAYNTLLKAYEHNKSYENVTQKIYILDRLISLKIEWGDTEKAIHLQRERHKIIMKDNFVDQVKAVSRLGFDVNEYVQRNLINSFETFILYYTTVGKYESASEYLIKHDSIVRSYNGYDKEQIIHWQVDAEMELSYFLGDYDNSIKSSNASSSLNINNKQYYIINASLFKGLSLYKKEKIEESKKFLNLADSIYKINSDLLSTNSGKLLYNTLIEVDNTPEKRLYYYNQLLKIDSTSLANYKILEPQFIRTFETPELLKSKEKTIEKLQAKNRNSLYLIIVSIIVIIASCLLAWNYYRQKVVYRRRYERLMKAENDSSNKSLGSDVSAKTQLSQEVIEDILRKLEKFEKNKDYLNSSLSLMSLAKKFNTNSSYLSRVLNSSKSINFSQYLNDLRIDFAVTQIKNDAVFRKYTIEAIAQESGYNNSASFSRSFYKKTGIHPSYFINEILKDQKVV